VYLVIVAVRYTFPGTSDVALRYWPVRIVAIDQESAEKAAMGWAELPKRDFREDAIPQAVRATTVEVLSEIDCIAGATA
jgi:hypothetical protein